jgi:hypothetical protein
MAARRRALLMIFSASPSSGASVSSGIRVSLMTSGPIEDDEHIATVADDEAGTRLDAFLAARFPIFSRNRIKDLILAGAVEVDGATNVTPKYRVKPAESIVLVAPQPIDAEPEGQDIALDILFEDDHLIVINKPAGLVVHPAPGNADGTLVNALLHHCGDTLSGIASRHGTTVSEIRAANNLQGDLIRAGHLDVAIHQRYPLADAAQELRMILQAILEPVVFRFEANENPGRLSMARYHDLVCRSKAKVAREIILHLR